MPRKSITNYKKQTTTTRKKRGAGKRIEVWVRRFNKKQKECITKKSNVLKLP